MNNTPRSASRWARWLNVRDRYQDPISKGTAQGILVVDGIILGGSLLWLLTLVVLGVATPLDLVVPFIGIAIGTVVYITLRRGKLHYASRLLVILGGVASSFVLIVVGGENRHLTLLFPVVLAGVLLDRVGVILTGTTLMAVTMVDTVIRIDPITATFVSTLAELIGVAVNIGAATAIQAVFVGRQRFIAQQARTELDGIERVLTAVESIDVGMTRNDVLSSLVRELRRTYRFDAVQVYLADSKGQLVQLIRAGLRRTEVLDLEADEVITPGGTHPLSDAVRFRAPVRVTLSDAPARRSHLMQNIQQGVAVPLVDGATLLGVVDIQSAQPDRISDDYLRVIQRIVGSFATLANLVHTNEQLAGNLREQAAIANRAQSLLTTEQAERRGMVTNIWSEYIDQRGERAMGFDIRDKRLTPAADLPDEMRQALEKRGEHLYKTATEKILTVPILLRGETLGAMSFALPLDHPVTERQIELSKTIAMRLGTALENTRLLEQTRLRAARERKATEISTLLFGASDVDALLKLAADNFNDTLGAIQTRIYIEPGTLYDPDPTPPKKGLFSNGHPPNGDHA